MSPASASPGPRPSPLRAAAARRTMASLSTEADVWEEFFDTVRIGLALADLTSQFLRVNSTYAGLLGRPPEDLVGQSFAELLTDGSESRADVEDLLHGRRTELSVEARFPAGAGREVWLLHGVSLVVDDDGQPRWFAVSAQDITERRRAEQELRDLTAALAERAVRDPLTGLANRALLEERLRGALARDARTSGSTGLLFLDLDGFKEVNDRHGHAVGDAVLKLLSQRLQRCVRPSDTVARLGGDEFVVLAEGAAADGLTQLEGRLRAAVAEPVGFAGLTLHLGVSVGVALSVDGQADVAGLLAEADAAMYEDKRRGGPAGRASRVSPGPGADAGQRVAGPDSGPSV